MTSSTSTTTKKRLLEQLARQEFPVHCNRIHVSHGDGNVPLVIDVRPFDEETHSIKTKCILRKTREFFEVHENFEQIRTIVHEEPGAVSLRILDFLVTNYAKKKGVAYMHNGQLINLFAAYKSALRAYSKRSFDAFCRRERILFKLESQHTPILTTHAQLNFLKWCCVNDVINYAHLHKAEIEHEMACVAKTRRVSVTPPNVTVAISTVNS